ncbi:MAG: CHAT domain-containing protein, partial [Cyanobacteria bacterium J06632_22]
DQLVADFRQALATRSARVTPLARQLDDKLMAPLRPHLQDVDHLLLSPDSQLNLIPFAALIDEQDQYLIESFQLTYLTSGRDLLRMQLDRESQQGPVILADPDYQTPGSTAPVEIASAPRSQGGGAGLRAATNQRSVDSTQLTFTPLPGTAEEAEAIAPLLPNATVLTQTQATENVLKQLQAPSILHIATHGFFLEDVEFFVPPNPNNRSASWDTTFIDRPAQVTPSNLENPLLRSGLALAGFNPRSSGSEDGVLTALEASGLNLYGTQLVVLSACETGVGSVSTGEGVYGLRRAFVTAGAESQLMSLWQVDDYGTSELMQLYYENLMEKGQGRSEALHNAQLELLNTGTYQHPFYWASFIFSGDWTPIDEN